MARAEADDSGVEHRELRLTVWPARRINAIASDAFRLRRGRRWQRFSYGIGALPECCHLAAGGAGDPPCFRHPLLPEIISRCVKRLCPIEFF
jgi:hypothetical protein